MSNILVINGSYRDGGVTDQMVNIAEQTLLQDGHRVDVVVLREVPIRFCVNCRHCTQSSGEALGHCVHDDSMTQLIAKIEASDAFVLASPTNFSSVTAIFKRFLERLTVFGDWPWGQPAPKMRRHQTKKALLLSSSAAPSIMARWSFYTLKQLKLTARVMGAKVVGSVNAGLIAEAPQVTLRDSTQRKIRRLTLRLI